MGGRDEEHRNQVIADAADDLDHERKEHDGEHEAAPRHMLERALQAGERTVPPALDLVLDLQLVGFVDEGRPEQRALETDRHQ